MTYRQGIAEAARRAGMSEGYFNTVLNRLPERSFRILDDPIEGIGEEQFIRELLKLTKVRKRRPPYPPPSSHAPPP